MTLFRVLIAVLLGFSAWQTTAAAQDAAPECEVFDPASASLYPKGLDDAVREVPEDWRIKLCSEPRGGSFQAVSPIQFENGVSYFSLLLVESEIQLAEENAASAREYFPVASFIMMTPNPENAALDHDEARFVETTLLSPGAFKNIMTLWDRIFREPDRRSAWLDRSALEGEDQAILDRLLTSAEDDVPQAYGASSFDVDPLAPPYFTLDFIVGDDLVIVDFDFSDFEKLILKRVYIAVEEFDEPDNAPGACKDC